MYIVELDKLEIQALLELIDAGVRARGLEVVQNALVLSTKLRAAKPKEEVSQ